MKLIKKDNKKGFTLIELVVVIAILAVLALILIPSITGYVNKANDSKNEANVRNIYTNAVLIDRTESNADLNVRLKEEFPAETFGETGTADGYNVSKTGDLITVTLKVGEKTYTVENGKLVKP